MSIQQFLLILRAHCRLALLIVSVVVVGTMAISLILPKQYIASASVLADIKMDPVAGTANASQQVLPANYIATQVDVVGSDRVARRVVKLLNLDSDPAEKERWMKDTQGKGDLTAWLAERLRSHLEVTPSRESNVINVAFESPNPQTSATMANAFAQAYIDTSVELKVAPARAYADWFQERSEALRSTLAAKQQKLAEFERDKGIVATDERLDIETTRLNQLVVQLGEIQAQREGSQSREKPRGAADTLPEVLQSPAVSQLKAQLSDTSSKLASLKSQLGTSHPEYIRTEAQIADLRDRIDQETARIVQSMNTTTAVDIEREKSLRTALEEQKARVLEMKRQRDQAAVLESDVATAQRDLDAVNTRLAQSSLESLSQQTTVILLTPATAPFRHSSPKLRSNFFIALFLGSALAASAVLLRELRDRRVRSEQDLSQILGVPLLGSIRSVTAEIVDASRRTMLAHEPAFMALQPPAE